MCFNIHTRAPANNSNYIAKCTFLGDKCDVSIKLDLFPPLVEPEMYIHVYSENSFVKILNSVTKSLLTMKCDLERARSVIQKFSLKNFSPSNITLEIFDSSFCYEFWNGGHEREKLISGTAHVPTTKNIFRKLFLSYIREGEFKIKWRKIDFSRQRFIYIYI